MSRIAKKPIKPVDGDRKRTTQDVPAIYIVLSNMTTDYGDITPIKEVKKRLKTIMRTLADDGTLDEPIKVEDVENIVETRFLVKRVVQVAVKPPTPSYIHAKTVCVDRKLLYVGSDNPYPHINEEYGCWIEDEPSVKAFMEGWYEGLWDRSNFTDDRL